MLIINRDLGDENDARELKPLPKTITTPQGTKIYPPAIGNLWIIKHAGYPATLAFDEFTARKIAQHFEKGSL